MILTSLFHGKKEEDENSAVGKCRNGGCMVHGSKKKITKSITVK
jgi:hypothetical protein